MSDKPIAPKTKMSIEERFMNNVYPEPNTGCWIWGGGCNSTGYGYFYLGEGACKTIAYHSVRAHRWAYEHFKEPIPAGMVIDHKCRMRCCVNPEHLRVVTNRVNTLENSLAVTAINRNKTHCHKGHEYTRENTRIKFQDGYKKRDCRTCHNEARRRGK